MTWFGWKRLSRTRGLASLSVAALAVMSTTVAQAQEPAAVQAQKLRSGESVQKVLTAGGAHAYALNLPAGQYLRAEFESRPQNFYVRIYDPANLQIADAAVQGNCKEARPCTLPFFAEIAGQYRVELRTFGHVWPQYTEGSDETYKLSVVAASAEQSRKQGESIREATAWLRANSHPLRTLDHASGFQDLLPLRNILGGARLIGLGEGTHGTREFFQVKHRLLEFLVREMAFTHLAMEVDQGAAEAINDYVMYGRGNRAEAIAAAGMWQWDTEEVTAMLDWMRDYNRAAPEGRRVALVGFDFQVNDRSREEVLAFLRRVAPERVAAAELTLAPLVRRPDPGRPSFVEFYTYSAEKKLQHAAEVKAIFDYLDANRARFVRSTTAVQLERVLHSARRMMQFTDAQSRPGYEQDRAESGVATRDRYMAQNIFRLVEGAGPNAKMAIWSHNEHVRRDPYNMAYYLGQRYGARYYAFGFAFNRGGFRALEILGKTPAPLKEFILPPALQSSVGWFMKRAAKGDSFVDFQGLPQSGPAAEWFSQAHPMRSIGNGYAPDNPTGYYRAPAVLGRSYDGIIFIEQTTPARGNQSSRR